MASNFDFLEPTHPRLYKLAREAEELAERFPRQACETCRAALEKMVVWRYEHDASLAIPVDSQGKPQWQLSHLLFNVPAFKEGTTKDLRRKWAYIKEAGNDATHVNLDSYAPKMAWGAVEDLFHVLYWLQRTYAPAGTVVPDQIFDRTIVTGAGPLTALDSTETLEAGIERAQATRAALTEDELRRKKAELEALKAARMATKDPHDYNEQGTRDRFIDLLLREAGWDPSGENVAEFEVQGMPTEGTSSTTGKGFVDYVLWGNDGLPLALVEAKRTRYSAKKGQHQAKLYADCLEKRFGRRPVIFCSNGYDHVIWDDMRYPPREVQGFYTRTELELVHHRRGAAKRLSLVQPNTEIVERSYQLEAIRRITEEFEKKSRKALLVMATGTGKTRTAIALVDLLKRADWVKRVLFLADRNALLTQAKRAFTTHLPSTIAVDITQNKGRLDATVVLSTYPTMMNRIDKRDGGRAVFGPGHFDLIIVDEAHRSTYKKYGAIFEYFDSLLIGLTATPRDEDNRDTYRLFDLEPGVPTAFYEFGEAVQDGYLVPYKGVSVPFRFLQTGIKYNELSDEAKEEYETKLADPETGEIPDHVNAAALNKWLFNIDTVDQALELVMEKGIKVEDGDRLGKTILFARNHKHAEFIEERFNVNYPHYKGKFAQIIDSHNDYAQSLLDDFSDPQKEPTLALSVDMLDTGVDIPECVNLVFFKPVRSRVKFNQMIGRGTRLCEDLFGPGSHKTCFLVFDLCSNFEFFSQNLTCEDPKLPDNLTARLVKARLGVVQHLPESDDEELTVLRRNILDSLHEHVSSMTTDNFLVRKHRRSVEEFGERNRWDRLTPKDAERVAEELSNLPNGLTPEAPEGKQFDLLTYRLMVALLQGAKSFNGYRDKVRDLAERLEEVATVPMVKEHLGLIRQIQDEDYWTDITLPMVEEIRRKLRGLVQFIDRKSRPPVYTDLPDPLDLSMVVEMEVPLHQTGFSPGQYRKKVEQIIRDNEDSVAIGKLRRNQPLTETDLQTIETMMFDPETIGSREQFELAYGKDLRLPVFIRRLVGLDRKAAKAAFGKYVADSGFTANQIRFVETVIDYLTKNGVMDPGLLYEPPFTDDHPDGIEGVFADDDVDNIIAIVRGFNETVDARFGVGG